MYTAAAGEEETTSKQVKQRYRIPEISPRVPMLPPPWLDQVFFDARTKQFASNGQVYRIIDIPSAAAVGTVCICSKENCSPPLSTLSDECEVVAHTFTYKLQTNWQPGIQKGAADWDENWDKFEDEGMSNNFHIGLSEHLAESEAKMCKLLSCCNSNELLPLPSFTFVKELTFDVENVVAPP
ncbi:hypothetical protein LOK49_LG14G00046 [Camellia lanceoleosa]|uniref:Uncharacterized protein n=1 Tax=Camellia lanceoleosa TaxID=1840588 RepID=A0ACC0F9T7_9ERIC|nr:hypothetical protein LOK49_LG14G00046 [Camellia lanceoleosa]